MRTWWKSPQQHTTVTPPRQLAGKRYSLADLTTRALFGITMVTGLNASAASIRVQATDATDKALEDVIVYALPASGKAPLKASPPAVIDQIRREFVPLVSVMQTGSVVSFPNKDNIRHHVYSFSPTKTFELRLYSGTQALPITFDKPGLVTLGCNIHDHMIAYVLVVDTPWFGKTDAPGSAVLDGLPPGEYELRAWHYRQTGAAVLSQRATVKNAGNEVSIKIDVKPGKQALHQH